MLQTLPFLDNNQEKHFLYALVDGALIDGFYDNLAKVDKLQFKSLFSGTIDAELAPIGPILLKLNPDIHDELAQKLLEIQQQQATPIWLQTDIAFTPLFNTLRKMLYVEKEDGSQHFFRYYDRECFPGFLSIAYKSPYFSYTIQKIRWATWQQNEEYQYYDIDKQGKFS